MALLDSLRPKWRHSNPEVRADALRRLDPGRVDVLSRVAREDSDNAVRRLAIKRLRDPNALAELGRSLDDEGLRKIAVDKADSLWIDQASGEDPVASPAALQMLTSEKSLASVAKAARRPEIRTAALGRINEAPVLADVAKNAGEASVRLLAVQRLTLAAALRSVALNDDSDEVALAAVERLEDGDSLDAIAKKSRRKGARKLASEKLAALPDYRPVPDKRRRAEQLELVARVEGMAVSHEFEKTAEELEEARETWKSLGADAEPELGRRFEQAWESFYEAWSKYRERRARVEVDSAPIAPAAANAPTAPTGEPGVESPPTPAERRDEPAVPVIDVEALLSEAERVARAGEIQAAQRRIRAIQGQLGEHPSVTGEIRARLKAASVEIDVRERAQRDKEEQRGRQGLKRLEALLGEAEGLATGNELGKAVNTLKAVQAALRRPGPLPADADRAALRARLEEADRKLHVRVQELREGDEWRRWANEPIREQLCGALEALADESDLAVVAARMRELQTAWREAGPVTAERFGPLRERFAEATKATRARLDVYFKQLKTERQANLEAKTHLCEQAEALKDSTDWRETAEELKRLQAEWKAGGPVPRAEADALWKRFRGACDVFFERRKQNLDQRSEDWKRNLDRKEALCVQAEEFAQSTDWDAAALKLKRLQAEWKSIGPVRRVDADAVWKRFRAACDTFFSRASRRSDVEREHELVPLVTRIEELESFIQAEGAAAPDPTTMATAVGDTWSERRQLELDRPAEKALYERLVGACLTLVGKAPDAFVGSELHPDEAVRKREDLCSRVESLVARLDEEPDAAPTDVEAIAAKLRQALAENAFRDGDGPTRRAQEVAADLAKVEEAWKQLPPVDGARSATFEERFRGLCGALRKRLEAVS